MTDGEPDAVALAWPVAEPVRLSSADAEADGEPVGERDARAEVVVVAVGRGERVAVMDPDPVRLDPVVRLAAGELVDVRLAVPVRVEVAEADIDFEVDAEGVTVCVVGSDGEARGDVLDDLVDAADFVEDGDAVGVRLLVDDLDADIVEVTVRVCVPERVEVLLSRGERVPVTVRVDVAETPALRVPVDVRVDVIEGKALRVPVDVLVDVIEDMADRVPVLVRVEVTEGTTERVCVGVFVLVRDGSDVMEGMIAPAASALSHGTSYSVNAVGAAEPRSCWAVQPGENPARQAKRSSSFILIGSRKRFLSTIVTFKGLPWEAVSVTHTGST